MTKFQENINIILPKIKFHSQQKNSDSKIFLVSICLLAFGHAARSIIVGNQTVIDKNFPIGGNAFFIIFKNLSKFKHREFVSTIYAKRKFDPSSSTSI